MIKYGFELEAFCLDFLGKPILVPSGLPLDECGWLVEVRSEPHADLGKAMCLLNYEVEQVKKQAIAKAVALEFNPTRDIPRDLKVQARRIHSKGMLKYRNLYGFENHRTKLATASLHISVSNQFEVTRYTSKGEAFKTFETKFLDHARLIAYLDRAFKQEIREAGRNPGFYEVKPDNRIEYRSLPNNVDLGKVQSELAKLRLD